MKMWIPLILALSFAQLQAQEANPPSLTFAPLDRSNYQENPLLELKKEMGGSKKKVAILANVSKGSPYINLMHIRDISDQGIEFFSDEKSEKYVQLKENGNVAILLRWEGNDGKLHTAKVVGKVDYAGQKTIEKEVVVNGQKEHLKWVSFKVVPTKVIFSEYADPSEGYGAVVSIVYLKEDGQWKKAPERTPYIMLPEGT